MSMILTSNAFANKPNIIVFSAISLNKKRLSFYGNSKKLSPNLTNFFKKAMIFENVIADTNWSNFLHYLKRDSWKLLRDAHYDIQTDFPIERKIPLRTPFFLQIDFPQMHFPYSDPKLFPEFLKKSFPLALDIILFKHLMDNVNGKNALTILSDETALLKWSLEKRFAQDKKLLRNAYDQKLSDLDRAFAEHVKILEKAGHLKNSIVIFIGDHSEPLLEHNELHAGPGLFEESISVPLMIYSPYFSKEIRIKNQINFSSITTLVNQLIKSKLPTLDWQAVIAQITQGNLYFRNCSGSQIGLRSENKWKLIYNTAKNNFKLFNLENDPGELKDIYPKAKAIATMLEEKMLGVDYSKINSPNKMSPCDEK